MRYHLAVTTWKFVTYLVEPKSGDIQTDFSGLPMARKWGHEGLGAAAEWWQNGARAMED